MCVSCSVAGFHLSWVEPVFNYWFGTKYFCPGLKPSSGFSGFSFLTVYPHTCSASYLIPAPLLCVLASVLLSHNSSNDIAMCNFPLFCPAPSSVGVLTIDTYDASSLFHVTYKLIGDSKLSLSMLWCA